MKSSGDPTLDRIRRTRHDISAACGHDPYKLVEYYLRLQERHRDRIVLSTEPRAAGKSSPLANVVRAWRGC